MKKMHLIVLLLFGIGISAAQIHNALMRSGWHHLAQDRDDLAYAQFWKAHQQAVKTHQTAANAEALLHLGFCTYGSSLERGLQFALQALHEYQSLETTQPEVSTLGRARCLQLISTVFSRQKNYNKAQKLSRETIRLLENTVDTTGTLGLAYMSLGKLNLQLRKGDSAQFYFKQAETLFKRNKVSVYLPGALIAQADLFVKNKQFQAADIAYSKAWNLAKATQNQQAMVSALLGQAKRLVATNQYGTAITVLEQAWTLTPKLTDKSFAIQVLDQQAAVHDRLGDYAASSRFRQKLIALKDTFFTEERERMARSLALQFELGEKDRQLNLVTREKEWTRQTNTILWALLGVIVVAFSLIYFYLKRYQKRDRELLRAKEAYMQLLEEQKQLKEQQYTRDLEHREQQLSSMTLQMLEKNELLENIQSLVKEKQNGFEGQLLRLVQQQGIQDRVWKDYDVVLENANRHFYERLKQRFPEISANDLKLCALIKMNLSIKEMAAILNISPDSVKTARHRLRKKLQMQTEDNLTEFLLNL
ncbi:tetratricopeptide repeat protein [Flavobacterium sp. N1719]|uniref:tetratricopeptide repeat protein n=1 Tax=Flavobacterium sp. N1719 TaxID=2885633 RepID=UPI002223D62A|nr:hypothetical protein [Flavobacterium sp. N1719]